MSGRTSIGVWMTNHLANPIVRTVLRSRAGRRFGRTLAVLGYRGRHSGGRHALVAQYARDGQCVWILPAHPDDKSWWRNFRVTSDVDLRLAGADFHGRAIALDGREHPEDVRRGLAIYLHQLPGVRRSLGLPAQPGVEPELGVTEIAASTVIVRIELDAISH